MKPLQKLLRSSESCLNPHIIQQFAAAIDLMSVVLMRDGTHQAGRQFAAWLVIMRNQSAHEFVAEPFSLNTIEEVWLYWLSVLEPYLSAQGMEILDAVKRSSTEVLIAVSRKPISALFIGDCLLWDAALQLKVHCLSYGIAVEPIIMAQRLGADLRSELQKKEPSAIQLVFYSPYTYEFSPEYAFAASPLNLFMRPVRTSKLLRESVADVKKTIDLLVDRFECPIYIHTVSGVAQRHVGWFGALKHLMAYPSRAVAALRLNAELSAQINAINQEADRPVERIDERNVLGDIPLRTSGTVAYDVGELHPTRLALQLAAKPYLQAVRVQVELFDKKLIICDLDNTLWDGLVGEGTIGHHLDRQKTLKLLKTRGILLAIVSKNDAKNVSWEGALLCERDFVAQMINWAPKCANIVAIANQLNLRPSNFVFLDDRPDERYMAESAIQGLVALDPNEPEVWSMLQHWAEIIPRSTAVDRTTTYHERVARENFLNSTTGSIVEGFRSLDLKVALRYPERNEINRVVELINRTNQFNTTAARTTKLNMMSKLESKRILIADVRDKFGHMGIVGALVVELGSPWRITHFVLSCRVFGYGIEDAMLNAVKRWSGGAATISATLIETAANGPCRDVFARNGFQKTEAGWTIEYPYDIAEHDWLTIDDDT